MNLNIQGDDLTKHRWNNILLSVGNQTDRLLDMCYTYAIVGREKSLELGSLNLLKCDKFLKWVRCCSSDDLNVLGRRSRDYHQTFFFHLLTYFVVESMNRWVSFLKFLVASIKQTTTKLSQHHECCPDVRIGRASTDACN